MKGLALRSLSLPLYPVSEEHQERPIDSVGNIEEKLAPWLPLIHSYYGKSLEFSSDFHQLGLEMFSNFSFDELCKAYYSSRISMPQSIKEFFERRAQYDVVRKIESSMWRWGMQNGCWNEVVEAYDNLRRFSFLGDPDFDIRLDYTTYHNEYGHSRYSRTYLDGVFAILIYYKRQHVMTIGFSIMKGRKLLIQQVQSAQRSGNRYLYRLPANRVEFVLSLFAKNFPGYVLYLIDGASLVKKTISQYEDELSRTRESSKHYRDALDHESGSTRETFARCLELSEESERQLKERINHLAKEEPRLISFYGDTGCFTLGRDITLNRLRHREVITTSGTIAQAA